jgi:hypothetical protein
MANNLCSLCKNQGHNSTTCTSFPVDALNNYIYILFLENIRYNIVNYQLENFQEKKDHIIYLSNLSLSELKKISRYYGLNTLFNRAILVENLKIKYIKLVKQSLYQDSSFFQEIINRNLLLDKQWKDKLLRENINIIIKQLQNNINNLTNDNLQNYVSAIGNHINNLALKIPSRLPEILGKNSFNIQFLFNDRPDIMEEEENNTYTYFDCPICLENKKSTFKITTNCNHNYCIDCLHSYILTCNSNKHPHCSLCRTKTNCYSSSFNNLFKVSLLLSSLT